MGIDIYVLNLLMKFKATESGGLGDALSLGRQALHFPTDETKMIATHVLRQYDSSADFNIFRNSGGYAERLFEYLGCRSIQSMDFSSYEGANIEHDLNTPIPTSLTNAFDFIFDGGTIEHVFDVPMAYRNVRQMLRDGGLFIGVNPANNFLGHGLYQFSPELLWRVFSRANGFSIESVQLVPVEGYPTPIDAPDPAAEKRRLQIGATPGRQYLTVAARKLGTTGHVVVQQSDYATIWERAKSTD
jgi:SAM-dependent methyltransferase